jgi:hypothetical protein
LERSSAATGRDALVDTGRLLSDRAGWPVLQSADQVLLAVRPTVRSVHAAQHAAALIVEELGDLGKVSAVVIGAGPYTASDVSGTLQVPLAGVLPHDPRASVVLSDGGSVTGSLARSRLMRAAAGLARTGFVVALEWINAHRTTVPVLSRWPWTPRAGRRRPVALSGTVSSTRRRTSTSPKRSFTSLRRKRPRN